MPRITRSTARMSQNIAAEILFRMSKDVSHPVTPPAPAPAPLAIRRTVSFGPDVIFPYSSPSYPNANATPQSTTGTPIDVEPKFTSNDQDNQAGPALSESEAGMDWESEEPSFSSTNIDINDVVMMDNEKDIDGDVIMKEPETQQTESVEVEMSTLPFVKTETPALSFASLATPPYQIASPLQPALALSASEDRAQGKAPTSPYARPCFNFVRYRTSALRSTIGDEDEPCPWSPVARPRTATLPSARIIEEDEIPALSV